MTMKKIRHLGYWTVIFLIVAAISTVLVLVVQGLWNLIMPKIMLCDKITFLQSAGLIILASLLTVDKSKLFSWLNEER